MRDGLILNLLSVVPKRTTSRLMGWFGRLRLPRFLLQAILRWYIPHYGVDVSEAARPVEAYGSLVDFFTRQLRDGARPIDPAPDAFVSPADGRVHALGRIVDGRLPQSPHLDFAVADLLGGDDRYDDGDFCVIYLSPRDYHRVHTPCAATVRGLRYRPGQLWPVFPAATRRVADLFARNERMVFRLDTGIGEVALVMVGAFGVGRMTTPLTELISNSGAPRRDIALEPAPQLGRADEIGTFELGSTVVLVVPHGSLEWTATEGAPIKLGESLGRIIVQG